ncbi:MAG: YbaK/EbsC family protein [Thermoleophilia bacterium]
MRSSSDVHNLLSELGVPHEILHLPASSRSARRAAELLAVPAAEVVKSLIFQVDSDAVLVLVPGDATADPAALAAALGGGEARLARGHQVLELTGYRAGAVPPCALAEDLPVVADPAVFAPDVVYCGGGATATMLKIRSTDLRALVRPRLVALSKRG